MMAHARWQVVFYRTASGKRPVREFLDSLAASQRAKALSGLVMLAEAGYQLGPPWLKKIEDDLWELRVLAGKVRLRFLFYVEGQRCVVLHGLKKKTERLPQRDLQTARLRCRQCRAQ